MGAFDSLLSSIGFPAANASQAIDNAQQGADAQTNLNNFQGGLSRDAILAQQEGNGVLSSGETGTKLANQATQQSYQDDIVQANAAQQVAAQQSALDQAKAQSDFQQQQLAQQAQQFNEQMAEQQAALKAQSAPFDPSQYFQPSAYVSPVTGQTYSSNTPNSSRRF